MKPVSPCPQYFLPESTGWGVIRHRRRNMTWVILISPFAGKAGLKGLCPTQHVAGHFEHIKHFSLFILINTWALLLLHTSLKGHLGLLMFWNLRNLQRKVSTWMWSTEFGRLGTVLHLSHPGCSQLFPTTPVLLGGTELEHGLVYAFLVGSIKWFNILSPRWHCLGRKEMGEMYWHFKKLLYNTVY